MPEYVQGASPVLLLEWWKPVVGYEGLYEVSNTGRIQSYKRNPQPYPLTPDIKKWGYRLYRLQSFGKKIRRSEHSLVAEAFIGPRPPGLVINHLNRCPAINRPSNLEYTTQSRNLMHSGIGRGENNGRAKVTESAVKVIRAQAGSRTLQSLADEHGMTVQGISRIIHRKCWKHVV